MNDEENELVVITRNAAVLQPAYRKPALRFRYIVTLEDFAHVVPHYYTKLKISGLCFVLVEKNSNNTLFY